MLGKRKVGSSSQHEMKKLNFLFVHCLRPLEIEDGWSLVSRHAFGACNYKQRSYQEENGMKIAKKCDGLPMAAVAHGTRLCSKLSLNDRNLLLESNIQDTVIESVKTEANVEVHNLTHDLATTVSSSYGNRLSYNRGLYDSFNEFAELFGLDFLCTFLALPLQEQLPLCFLSNRVVHDLLPTMKQLLLLSLSNYKSITECNIERLPSETCKLYNLQFLLLVGCRRLIEFPEDIGKLVNLHHLDVSDTALREMPVQIAKLENLQTSMMID
ncbi:NB-ARC domain disease resistance protein [Medicago truncatula]|uniref:NB-ARC domain disease resistance protein n=1 Tax=Medicago truncatula TaxID=3880 RepID=A0A072UTG0_MEDTR|nr:NB-ARC domain disease resistance protein [Medicago truncatula]